MAEAAKKVTPPATATQTGPKLATATPITPGTPTEGKHDKFKRLGGIRVAKAIKAIEMVGNLASANYEYTQAEVNAMSNAISKAVNGMLEKFVPRVPGSTTKVKGAKLEAFKFE